MSSKIRSITILQLYPHEMNIYGDYGNVLVLRRRLEWHGYKVEVLKHSPGDQFAKSVDIVVGGGGQDSGQDKVKDDLLKNTDRLHTLADNNIPMLMVCGLYQLFGRFFKTSQGHKIPGIGIFKAETHGGPERLIGNVVTKSKFGKIIGYENHSGLTYLDNDQPPLGKVTKGKGNNGSDHTEGAVYRNVIGSYLHGSLLPKNPSLAEHLIEQAVLIKYGEFLPRTIDDSLALKARRVAEKRPR